MIALLQRVTGAEVRSEGELLGHCGRGLLVLFCAEQGDTSELVQKLARKTARLRIFQDDGGKMNLSVKDVEGSALVVSQFTLAADTRSGNRPSFTGAAAPDEGRKLYEEFVEALRAEGVPAETGRFGASMQVSLVNDGPVTIWLRLPS
ncbi:MAG: D-aminoacyl-tRNA deacylase [Sutterellaceae bacterium]|nr:D-aminoacyl-tRNA deacylase [Sutterellaceae bacterium]MDD7442186.1 D-aminoacyl-tRNA deacylase [Sutterellaceae bacterium]MDY2868181.1 D-aminoacyl-tRNA deacylase [Mesosutterella sp.]